MAAAHGRRQGAGLQVVDQLIGANLHHRPLGQRQPGDDALTIDERTVGAAQVADDEAAVRLAADLGMAARDGRVIEMHLARRVAADDRLLQLGHLLHAQWPGLHPAAGRPFQRQAERVAGQVANAQDVAGVDRARRLGRHLQAVVERAVGAAHVGHTQLARLSIAFQQQVVAGDGREVNDDIVVGRAAQAHRRFVQRTLVLLAAGPVDDQHRSLRLGHDQSADAHGRGRAPGPKRVAAHGAELGVGLDGRAAIGAHTGQRATEPTRHRPAGGYGR